MSFLGTLGKIGAGIAAPFTGGASLYAIPAIGALEGGLSDKNHDGKKDGLKGALTGGAIGAGEMFIPGAVGHLIPGAAGSAVGKALGAGIMPAGIGNSVNPSDSSYIADDINGAANKASGGGLLSTLGNIGKKVISGNADRISDAGRVLAGFGAGEANNRVQRGQLTQGYDRLRLAAEENQRASESDALRKLAITGYLQSGGRPYSPPAGLPSYGFGPVATTQAQRQGGASLEGQLLNRLKPGGTYMPTDLGSYANRGVMENVANYGGLILGGIGAMSNSPSQNPAQPGATPPIVDPQTGANVTNSNWMQKLGSMVQKNPFLY